MRVSTDRPVVAAEPGATTAVVLDVINTSAVIDGVSTRVIGPPDLQVSAHPELLPLFPDATGSVTLSLTLAPAQPAGRLPLTVEMVSHGAREPSTFIDIELDVAPRPSLRMIATPRMVRARRVAQFSLELHNEGNVPLEVSMRATDAERAVSAEFSPPELRVPAGATATVLLRVAGPRLVTAAEIDRTVTVAAIARRVSPEEVGPATGTAVPLPDRAADTAADATIPGNREATVRLRQRPLLGRGLATAAILMAIVSLWAGAFLLGITKVFSNDPFTKDVPASFFAADTGAGAQNAVGGAGGTLGGAPAGALPKSGQLPAGLGGEVTGTVTASSNLQPVGRILVQAFRKGPNGLEPVAQAATQTDGTYSISGLFPADYYLQFSATGYRPLWYDGVASQRAAQPVTVASGQAQDNVDVVMTGLPASVTGTVDLGPNSRGLTTEVTAQPLDAAGTISTAKAVSVKASASGAYSFAHLQAPGKYLFTFVTPGYQPSTMIDTIAGGDSRREPVVTPGAGQGQISGLVLGSNGVPIGGATVTTTVGGVPLQVTTPTTGQVGAFALTELPTPGTYVVTVTADNYSAITRVYPLTAGRSMTGLVLHLTGGVGAVSGTLVDRSGRGLGGASVTVTGAATTNDQAGVVATTTTLTAPGVVGEFAVSGLPAGQYTFAFSLDGYQPTSVPIDIAAGAPPALTVRMASASGQIEGVVLDPTGKPLQGATVTATDGLKIYTTTSTNAGGALPDGTRFPAGGFYFTGLAPGSYSVTATATNPVTGKSYQASTRIVAVRAGATTANQLLKVAS